MKKNKMMRAASILLVAVLLTTSIISGTFAKYVTSGEAEDSARVAKFGVTIAGSGSLFAQNYYNVVSGLSNQPAGADTVDEYDNTLTVESSNGDKVVAPGTKSADDGLALAISGAPEVDVKIALAIEDGSKDVWLGQGAYPNRTTAALNDSFENGIIYKPITYTLKLGNQQLVQGNLDAIKAFLETYSLYVDANTNMTGNPNYTYTLTWAWDFDDAGAGTYDKQDTLLGDIAAFRTGDACDFANVGETSGDMTTNLISGTHYNIDVDVKLSVTVTQVD